MSFLVPSCPSFLCLLQVAFDASRQVQVVSFLVQRPKSATDYCELPKRSVPGQ
jgi:ribulose bisphosphate carboxylase small subunit